MMKGTLSLTNLNPKIKNRDRLFFDRYEYAVEIPVRHGAFLRGMLSEKFNPDDLFRRLFKYHKNSLRFGEFYNNTQLSAENQERLVQHITRRVVDLRKVYDFLKELHTQQDFRLSVFYNGIRIHTNDPACIMQAAPDLMSKADSAYNYNINLTRVVIDRPRNTIKLKKSDWKFRLKFRHVVCSESAYLGLNEFIKTYKEHCGISISLEKFLAKRKWSPLTTTESHYFIDVADEKLATIFEIMAPGILDRVLTIISDK